MTIKSSKPFSFNSLTMCSIMGRFAIGTIGLGVLTVRGRRRVPKPPAIMIARISSEYQIPEIAVKPVTGSYRRTSQSLAHETSHSIARERVAIAGQLLPMRNGEERMDRQSGPRTRARGIFVLLRALRRRNRLHML